MSTESAAPCFTSLPLSWCDHLIAILVNQGSNPTVPYQALVIRESAKLFLLFATRDCSQRDRHVERRTQEFFRLPFTEMITTGAHANEGLQAWSKGALRDAVGKLATRGFAAV